MKKHIPPLFFIAGAVLLCVYIARAVGGIDRHEVYQIAWRFGALFLFDAGLLAHTLIHRRDNVSTVNFGFKLMGEGFIFLAVLVAMLKVIIFG